MASTITKITWITCLARDLNIPLAQTPQLFCDNIRALHLFVNPMFHVRSKHIELDFHFVWKKVAMSSLTTQHIPSSSQPTDIFTKSLPKATFQVLEDKLGVYP